MQSTASHQALHSYPLIITHTHSLTYLKCLSKMSLRDLLHANYGSSSFSVPFYAVSLSLFFPTLLLSLLLSVLSIILLCVSLNTSFSLLSCLYIFTLPLSSFPQVSLEHTFTDKSILCVQIKM